MPLSLRSFDTISEARAALSSAGARYLGGGTLSVRAANEGQLGFDTLVRALDPGLSGIEIDGRRVRLGASVTMAAILRHRGLGAIAAAARAVGGPAIRTMATVGGNLFAPTPYGDFAVALLALGARVEADGRWIDLDDFLPVRGEFRGIVTAIEFDLPADGAFRFLKVSRVRPKGVSVLSLAASIDLDEGGLVRTARIAIGCMADRPIRAEGAEAALLGARLDARGIEASVAAVSRGIAPPTDAIASEWYRREVLPVHFRRFLLG